MVQHAPRHWKHTEVRQIGSSRVVAGRGRLRGLRAYLQANAPSKKQIAGAPTPS